MVFKDLDIGSTHSYNDGCGEPAHNTQKPWTERFDEKINSDNFEKGEYNKLLGDHLLDPEWYPESPYELDGEKIKSFISSLLTEQKENLAERVRSEERQLPKRIDLEIDAIEA